MHLLIFLLVIPSLPIDGRASNAANLPSSANPPNLPSSKLPPDASDPTAPYVPRPSGPCHEGNCRLPDCFCSGSVVPGQLPDLSIPQFVMLAFDDGINDRIVRFYEKLFGGRRNPDGCEIRGTFFVRHEYNDYWLTRKLYSEGHEIASHSLTHESAMTFKQADLNRWIKEIGGMKKTLELFAQIPKDEIKGFRAPFLQSGGDLMIEALNRTGMLYDSSMPASENKPPIWPYTLNFASTQECKVSPCPKDSHPGIWEVPLVYYEDGTGRGTPCSTIDACLDGGDRASAYDMLLQNFMRHYTSNRAPFPMFMQVWFMTEEYRWTALTEFIDTVLMLPDVYFVTISDVIQWIRNPIECGNGTDVNGNYKCTLDALKDWSCRSGAVRSRPPVCPWYKRSTCVLKRPLKGKLYDRNFDTCSSCPESYPWLGNPDGGLLKMLERPVDEPFLWNPPRGVNVSSSDLSPKKKFRLSEPESKTKGLSKSEAMNRLRLLLMSRLKDSTFDHKILAKVFGDLDAV